MFKKIFSMILVLFICCSTSITVFTQTEHSLVEENDVSNDNEKSAIISVTSPPQSIVTTDAEMAIDSIYVQTATVDSEYLEWLLGTPDEIMSASTIELLEYFLKTPFMGQQVYTCASTPNKQDIDFSCHEAFRELISRRDFMETLEDYAESILYGSKRDELDKAKFEKLLVEPFVTSLISDLEYTATNYPSLQNIYTTSEVVTSSVGDLVGTIGDIRYYSAGTISTANNRNVEVCTPHREWSSSEITNINSAYDYAGNTRLDSATTVYNCHSYAWYRYSTTNPYWIMDITQFVLDSACTQVTTASAQAKDIIVYLDANGIPLHSGVVYSVSSSGELTICSKWGQAGAYIHDFRNVPLEYCVNSNDGIIISYVLFRYHDYANYYTGNEHHLGNLHYFQYADICEICNKQINTTWTSVACSGPPCLTIMKLKANTKYHSSVFCKLK